MVKKERQSNIELLRLIAMIGVIILHINNPAIGEGESVKVGSINQFLVYYGESLFIIGVNVFIAITGYFMISMQERNVWRLIELLF